VVWITCNFLVDAAIARRKPDVDRFLTRFVLSKFAYAIDFTSVAVGRIAVTAYGRINDVKAKFHYAIWFKPPSNQLRTN